MDVLGGMTGGSFYFFTENTALEITLATNVSFIVCTAPLLTTILSLWVYKKEKATRGLMAGSLLALVGVALVVYNGSFVLKISPLGDFLTLLAAFSWAFYSLIMRKMSNRYGITFITRKIFLWGIDHSSCISGSSLEFRHCPSSRAGYSVQFTFPGCIGFLDLFCSLERSIKTAGNDKSFQLYLSESSLHSGRFCFSAWRTAYYSCFDGGDTDIGGSLLGRKKINTR